MTIKLYPHQEISVNFALLHQYTLNGSEMGIGKTLIALETARRTRRDPLIFGPAFLQGTWENECVKLGVTGAKYVPYSQVHKLYPKDVENYQFWIADEVHYLKNPTAMRTHAVYALLKKCLPPYFIGLSGTVLKNKVPDLWTLLAMCSQCPTATNGLRLEGDLTKYRAFSRYFCNVELQKIRGRTIEKFSGVKEAKIPELRGLLKDKYIRFKIADVIDSLPSITRKEVMLNIRPVPGLEEAFDAYMAGTKLDPTSKATSALLKAHDTAAYVEDMLEVGESVLVFSDHIMPAKEIAAKLKGVCITGAMKAEERHQHVEAFQRGDLKVIVATIGALSVGVTLTKSRHVVFNDISWSYSDNAQALARIHRIGQKNACIAHYMLGSETDVHIARTVLKKEDTALRVLG